MLAGKKGGLLLVSRILVAAIFIVAGWMKVSDMASTVNLFSQMHIPAFLAYVVGYAEFLGGIALLLGLWASEVSALLAIIMIVAVGLTWKMGFQVYMAPMAVLAATLALAASGPGAWALKWGRKNGSV